MAAPHEGMVEGDLLQTAFVAHDRADRRNEEGNRHEGYSMVLPVEEEVAEVGAIVPDHA